MSFLSKEEMQKVAEGLEPCPLCKSDKLYVLRVSNGVVCPECGCVESWIDWSGWLRCTECNAFLVPEIRSVDNE